jgi:hypothetical protein
MQVICSYSNFKFWSLIKAAIGITGADPCSNSCNNHLSIINFFSPCFLAVQHYFYAIVPDNDTQKNILKISYSIQAKGIASNQFPGASTNMTIAVLLPVLPVISNLPVAFEK